MTTTAFRIDLMVASGSIEEEQHEIIHSGLSKRTDNLYARR